MAWNPSPTVALARDAALAFGRIHRLGVRACVIIYELEDGRMSYASYGPDRKRCAAAQDWAERLLEHTEADRDEVGDHGKD